MERKHSAEVKPKHRSGLLARTKKRALLLLGFILLTLWFGVRLATGESPEKWQETHITVADIQYISGKASRYQLTDTEGNTYSLSSDNEMAGQITPGGTYHIIHSQRFHNGIRGMTQDGLVIVDYGESVSRYGERGALDWILCFVGLMGSIVTIGISIAEIRTALAHKGRRQ